MRYRILGRLTVWNGREWTQISASRWRSLLAYLLVNANRFVPAERLVAELWGDRPPDSAAKSLQVYVYRLRRALGDPPARLLTRPSGYELSVAPGEVDADRFTELIGRGRQALAQGSTDEALRTLVEALALWRGDPLADVPSTATVAAEAERLAEHRLAAWESLADAKLAAGRHAELVAELRALVAEEPLREPLWAKLMTALHRSGRRSDALAAYASAHRVLVDELGVPPGVELQQTYQGILTDDGPGPVPEGPPAEPWAPAYQLPARLPDFVGRTAEVERVRRLLAGPPDADGTPAARTVVVAGTPGVGKTAFAVYAGHLLRDAFPDGQLFAELRGADNRPAEPEEVLASLLKSLGITGAELPEGLAERSRRYRAELAGRRTLVVLDNASHERQVRPLLPGSGTSAVLVTSRNALAGLEAAARVDLDVLPDAEALALLAAAVGDDRARREPEAVGRLIRLCGNLPLALRIAGARLSTRRYLSATRLAETLDDERRRLDELRAGDLEVRSSVALSYDALDPPARRALRLLGMLNTLVVPEWVVGALLGCGHQEAERITDALVDDNLLEFDSTGAAGEPRYRLHDLVRLFARERDTAEETAASRTAALTRVCEAYAAMARRADAGLADGFLGSIPAAEPAWLPRAADVERLLATPLRWLESERSTLCALVRQAASAGLAGVAWRLAASLATYFEIAAHFDDWRDTHEVALAAAHGAGDRLGVAVMYRNLGELDTVVDRYDQAGTEFEAALRAYREAGQPGESAASGLGVLRRLQGRHEEASDWLERSIGGARASGNIRAEAYAQRALVSVYLERGEIELAEWSAGHALALTDRIGYRNGEAATLRSLGLVRLAAGRLAEAREELERAGALAAEVGDQAGEVHGRQWLAHVVDLGGDPELAEALLDECLSAYRRLGEPFGEALTLRTLADLYLHSGRTAAATAAVDRSLSTWRRVHSPYWTSRSLDLAATVAEADGRPEVARQARGEAAALRQAMGLPADLRPGLLNGREIGGHLHRPAERRAPAAETVGGRTALPAGAG
ncbi:BTAD domain-containing putative transcriptional regulator [Micromonospora sp. NPDC049559]|uniref:AfsR/SARP family transcriptional regulator n=1 Tax=Micromonospora sp. NPDC049559 TaxID=3155923 RepID=UPI0034347599